MSKKTRSEKNESSAVVTDEVQVQKVEIEKQQDETEKQQTEVETQQLEIEGQQLEIETQQDKLDVHATKDNAAKKAAADARKKTRTYVATKYRLYHPFAEVYIPLMSPGVELDLDDSWLQSQIDAGLVKEL